MDKDEREEMDRQNKTRPEVAGIREREGIFDASQETPPAWDAKQEAEWPQVGDYYHVISTDGEIDKHRWQGGTLDTKMLNSPLGIYPTHTKAEEAAGKIKRVMDHLREGHEVDLAKWQHNGSARIKKDTIKL